MIDRQGQHQHWRASATSWQIIELAGGLGYRNRTFPAVFSFQKKHSAALTSRDQAVAALVTPEQPRTAGSNRCEAGKQLKALPSWTFQSLCL